MSFRSRVFTRVDGRACFVATEDGFVFESVKRERWESFTDAELLALKLDAMATFDRMRVAG